MALAPFLLLVLILIIFCQCQSFQTIRGTGLRRSSLFAKAKSKVVRLPGARPQARDKVRVKLLKDVESGGFAAKKGDLVFVSSPMWLNKLQPEKLAILFTDDMVKLVEENRKRGIEHARNTLTDYAKQLASIGTVVVRMDAVTQQISHQQIAKAVRALHETKVAWEVKDLEVFEMAEGGEKGPLVTEIRRDGAFLLTLALSPDLPPVPMTLQVKQWADV